MPQAGEIDYTKTLTLDLASVLPSVAGPKRPQDRIELSQLGDRFRSLLELGVDAGGFGLPSEAVPPVTESTKHAKDGAEQSAVELGHGSVLIAAITSCTNTSNPSVMVSAGLLAKRAVERGLSVFRSHHQHHHPPAAVHRRQTYLLGKAKAEPASNRRRQGNHVRTMTQANGAKSRVARVNGESRRVPSMGADRISSRGVQHMNSACRIDRF